jgi:Ni/Co efflux regulator RcnB
MKALLTAFALLSFVAASTMPMVASAAEMNDGHTSTMHHHKKVVHHKVVHHHHAMRHRKHHVKKDG